jgi:glutamate transport system substrate-binding protein
MIDVRAAGRVLLAVSLVAWLVGCGETTPPVFPERVNVGGAPSSPGWGSGDPAGNRSGFDYQLTNYLGRELHFTPIHVTVLAKDRETSLETGIVSMVIATYSITDQRRKRVGFAGPYALTNQGIMVRAADSGKYRVVNDLNDKTICATTGSTSMEELLKAGLKITPVAKDVYEECRVALDNQDVDAVSTDQLLLFGISNAYPQKYYVPPSIQFGQQGQYGVGLPKGDKVKCDAVTEELKDFLAGDLWEQFFSRNLPGIPMTGHKPDPNKLYPCPPAEPSPAGLAVANRPHAPQATVLARRRRSRGGRARPGCRWRRGAQDAGCTNGPLR